MTLVTMGFGSFLGRTVVTHDDLDQLLPVDPRLQPEMAKQAGIRAESGETITFLSVGSVGIKPFLRLRTANPDHKLRVVTTDEGIGSYGTWQTRRDAWRREGGKEPWPTVRAATVYSATAVLRNERWAAYGHSEDRWQVDERVAAEFRRHAQRDDPLSRNAVFLSQPWVELGVTTRTNHLAFVSALAEIVEAAGLVFQVRPHPIEDASHYSPWMIHGGATPAELSSAVVNCAAVLGATSTALLNLAAIHDVPAIRLTPPGAAKLDAGLSSDQASLLDQFVGAPVSLDQVGDALGAVAH